MKKQFLLLGLMSIITISASAEKVDKYFRVSDSNFNVSNWEDADNPNSINVSNNSFTIPTEFGSVSWDFGGDFWLDGVDMSSYDRLVIRLTSVVGNTLQFRIFDYAGVNGGVEYAMPDNVVPSEEEVEYEVDLSEGLENIYGEALDMTNIKKFVFWNYWATEAKLDENGDPVYDDDGNVVSDGEPSVTVTIGAMYLERTLADGEKDYVDLLAAGTFSFSDYYFDSDDDETTSSSYIDNTGTLHINENATAGLEYEDGADWSAYKYLVIVPQVPASDETSIIDYNLTDLDDNVFTSGGSFRYGPWNKSRACVLDLTALLTTPLGDTTEDDPELLEEFNTTQIASLSWSLWGGVATWEYGIAGVYLSNTAPSYSTGLNTATDNTGDYVRDNASENTISTICLPFAAAVCGAQVYEIAGVDSKTDPSEIYAAPHKGLLEPGKPYVLRSNSARNITAFSAGANEESVPQANGALMANSFPTYYVEADKNYCVLNSDGDTFEAVTSKSKRVNSNTAYLSFNDLEETTEQENGLVFGISGVDTSLGVEGIANDAPRIADNRVYDISGRVVANPSHGIYIKNGRKYIVR